MKILSDFPKTSAPTQRALDNAGIKNLKQLTKFNEEEILDLHGMGPKSMKILKHAMKDKGYSFSK